MQSEVPGLVRPAIAAVQVDYAALRVEAGAQTTFDVHAHYVASDLIDALAREGPRHGLGVAEEVGGARRAVLGELRAGLPFLPDLSDVSSRLAWADRSSIEHQLVASWMDLAAYHLEASAAAWLARIQNETISDLVRAHPDRFSGAAMVPLQDPPRAAAELAHAVRSLGLRAVQIGTHINGRGLDEPELDPFWNAAQELDVPVIVHPVELGGPDRERRYFMHILIGNPAQTTWAAGALLLGGVLERFPRLRVLLVHGGGALPYVIGRLARGFTRAPAAMRARATRPPATFLGSLFFDTILHDVRALRYLIEVVGTGSVVIGTDYPFPLQDPDPIATRAAVEDIVSPEAAHLILAANARRMLAFP